MWFAVRRLHLRSLLPLMLFALPGYAQTADNQKSDEVAELRQMVRELSARVAMLEEQAHQQHPRMVSKTPLSDNTATDASATSATAAAAPTPEPAGAPRYPR